MRPCAHCDVAVHAAASSGRDSTIDDADEVHDTADEYDDDLNREIGKKEEENEDPSSAGKKGNTSMNEAGHDENAGGKIRVPVHEDFLFDVDIEQRELSPVYWLGPIYEVRRGSWFFQEGST